MSKPDEYHGRRITIECDRYRWFHFSRWNNSFGYGVTVIVFHIMLTYSRSRTAYGNLAFCRRGRCGF